MRLSQKWGSSIFELCEIVKEKMKFKPQKKVTRSSITLVTSILDPRSKDLNSRF